jgi:hypothetical protein
MSSAFPSDMMDDGDEQLTFARRTKRKARIKLLVIKVWLTNDTLDSLSAHVKVI